jgi:HAD superfamily hydrolase (TIGR01509 family)
MPSRKKQKAQGVLFDWDGTLIDSYHADSSAYLAMFREMGITWGLAEFARHYSPNWYRVYRAAGLPRSRWKEADIVWRREYANYRPDLIKGVPRILAALKLKYRLGLVTSGDRDRVSRQLRTFQLTRLFATRVCSGDTLRKKPHPEPLRLALQKMRLSPENCVYVGDSLEDMEMACRAGVRSIGVVGLFHPEKRLRASKPHLLLNSIQELPDALKELLD